MMFQAFVMTGDRMINLAKTPANADFQSRHTRQTVTSSNLTERLHKAMHEEEEEKVDTKTLVKQVTTSLPSSPKEQMENSMDQRLPVRLETFAQAAQNLASFNHIHYSLLVM